MRNGTGAVLSGALNTFAHARVSGGLTEEASYGTDDNLLDSSGLTNSGTLLHECAWAWFRDAYKILTKTGSRISTASDVPRGSGLGASSALTVAILGALYRYFSIPITRGKLAKNAYFVERSVAGVAGGYQDHYAASFGGLNYLQFHSPTNITVEPLSLSCELQAALESRITLIFSGSTRNSEDIINWQNSNLVNEDPNNYRVLREMAELASKCRDSLIIGDFGAFSDQIAAAAAAKRDSSPVSYNYDLDALCKRAVDAGADVCKVSGAGGGGFVMAISKPHLKSAVDRALEESGVQPQNVTFDNSGLITWHE